MENTDISSLISGIMSNPDVMSKLSSVLSDTDMMKSISSMASDARKEESTPQNMPIPVQSDESRNRARLISALKPYLNKDRRDKADKLLGLLSILELTGSSHLFGRGD